MLRTKFAQLLERGSLFPAPAAMLLLAFATAAFSAHAQQASDSPPDSPPVVHLPGSHAPTAGEAATSPDVYLSGSQAELSGSADPRAREEAAKFAELTGVRQKLEQKFPSTMQTALAEMRRRYPNLDPRMVAEWEKRMRVQFNPDDYIAVFINVYARHFTADELEEMIQAVRAQRNSKPVTLSPELGEKIRANAVQIQSEIIGGFTEVGASKGGRIGGQIGREHPDWVRNLNPAASAGAK